MCQKICSRQQPFRTRSPEKRPPQTSKLLCQYSGEELALAVGCPLTVHSTVAPVIPGGLLASTPSVCAGCICAVRHSRSWSQLWFQTQGDHHAKTCQQDRAPCNPAEKSSQQPSQTPHDTPCKQHGDQAGGAAKGHRHHHLKGRFTVVSSSSALFHVDVLPPGHAPGRLPHPSRQ